MHYVFALFCFVAILLNLTTVDGFRMHPVHLAGANQVCVDYCNSKDCKSGYRSMNDCECTECETPVSPSEPY